MNANREVANHVIDGMDGMGGIDDMDVMNGKKTSYLLEIILFTWHFTWIKHRHDDFCIPHFDIR